MKILSFFIILFAPLLCRAATAETEIEGLLHYVKSLDGAVFIRNGDAHAPAEAEAHLRLKWNNQKSKIISAEDFIRLCGTNSSLSGKPYTIKFKDGREETAAKVLQDQLALLRSKPVAISENWLNLLPKLHGQTLMALA